MRTAFFGGSFNPPHRGHLGVARGALASGRTDRVLWGVAFAPPHKPGRPMAPFADRMNMVELLIAGESDMACSDIEARLARSPSYTIDVLAALCREEPETQFQLLIGGDSLRELHTWRRARELAEDFEILTYPRAGETPDETELARHWPHETAEKLARGILPGNFFEISSTNLRNLVANHAGTGHIMQQEVPDALAEYIRNHQFYQKDPRS